MLSRNLKFLLVTLIAMLASACGRLIDLEEGEDTWSLPAAFNQKTCQQMKADYLAKETSPVVREALEWVCKYFKYNKTLRCADFVSTVVEGANFPAAGFFHTLLAADFSRMGTPVSYKDMKPGDIVLYKNTYRIAPYTHVGVYIGNDLMIHRPSFERTVEFAPIWKDKFAGARRLVQTDWNSFAQKTFILKEGINKSVVKSNTEQSSNGNVKCTLTTGAVLVGRVSSAVSNHLHIKIESTQNASAGCPAGTIGYIYEDHFRTTIYQAAK